MSRETSQEDESLSKECSAKCELAHQVIHNQHKLPPFLVEKAYKYLEVIGGYLQKDVQYGIESEEFAQAVFSGTYHYSEGPITPGPEKASEN